MTDIQQSVALPSRRGFLSQAALVAAGAPAAAILGPTLIPYGAATADAATSTGAGLPTFAPVPASSFGPALNANGYFVGPIHDNLYWVTDGFYQSMFLATAQGVVVVDAPPTIGHNLLRAINDVTVARGTPSTVTHLVYSHFHADHIGASSIFDASVIRVGHVQTRSILRAAGDPNRPAPTVTFTNRHVLEFGLDRLELTFHGPNHTPDNIFIFAPRHRTLMVVDVFFPGWVPFKNLAISQDIPGWVRAHDIAMDYPWTSLVGGHVGRLGVRADGDLQRQYLRDLETSVMQTMAGLDPTPFFVKYGPSGNAWAIFKTYLDAAARRAAAPVVDKYLGQLGGADVFTVDNAFALFESLRVDAGTLGPFGIRP
jgi:glyoxylase-like metal-dependent hydrolase (beta-lactamase superfamily II)